MVWEACKDDTEALCKGIKDGGGRIQSCLVRKLKRLACCMPTSKQGMSARGPALGVALSYAGAAVASALLRT